MYLTRKYECKTAGCQNYGREVTIRAESVGVPPLMVQWPKPVCPNCHVDPVMTENSDGQKIKD